ncbi:MAG: hypothetical protein SFV17_21380 [Candidatus Obscuribacter sp.]|nr:hypothetical protein [Candidatus Obscuribacter sp.]
MLTRGLNEVYKVAFTISVLLTVSMAAVQARPLTGSASKSLTFPAESIGKLSLLSTKWRPGANAGSQDVRLGPARGTMEIPAGARIKLEGNYNLLASLEPLKVMQGHDLLALELTRLPITNTGLKGLDRLTSIEHLSLENTDVDDKVLPYLTGLKDLKYLNLRRTMITGSLLPRLQHWTKLNRLKIGHNALKKECITAAAFASLKALPRLEELQISSAGLDDESLKGIAEIKQLHSLDISGNQKVSEAGLSYLASMPRLYYLNLGDIKLPARAVCKLGQCGVHSLVLSFRFYTPAELEAIKACLPGRKIADSVKNNVPLEMYAPLH